MVHEYLTDVNDVILWIIEIGLLELLTELQILLFIQLLLRPDHFVNTYIPDLLVR